MKKNVLFILIVMVALVLPASGAAAPEDKSPAPPLPGETNFKNIDSLIILFTTTPEVLGDLIPKPLVPNEWNLMWVSISRVSLRGIDFNEMVIGTPVGYRSKMFNYMIYRIVDHESISSQTQAVMGRKTPMGRISFEKSDGKVKARVERDGRVLASAEWAPGKPGGPLDALPTVVLREIPFPPQEGVPPEVRQLVWGTTEDVKVNEAVDGITVLNLEKPVRLPVDIPVVTISRGVYRNADFTVRPQGVLYDYLKKKRAN